MSYQKALDFLNSEIAEGTVFPHEYTFTSPEGGEYKVIILPPNSVRTLSGLRKQAGFSESYRHDQAINFAPLGGCACCGR